MKFDIKIAICDDNIYDCNSIENMLKMNPFYKKATVIKFVNGTELLNSHKKNNFDIILLDVDMPEHSGIEIGKYLRQNDTETILIFVTNYPQYAIEGYDCNAFHYLLKPINEAKFNNVINKAIRKKLVYKAKIKLTINGINYVVKIQDIYYIEASQYHKITYYTDNGGYTVRGTLSEALDKFSHFGFFQIHKAFIVNLNKVTRIANKEIIFDNKKTAPISDRRLKEVELVFTEYLEMTL